VAIESASWRPILAPQGSGPDGVRSRPPGAWHVGLCGIVHVSVW